MGEFRLDKNVITEFAERHPNVYRASDLSNLFLSENPNCGVSYSRLRQGYFKDIARERVSIASKEQLSKEVFTEKHPGANISSDITTVDEERDTKSYSYKGEKPITSLEEAIEFFEIDLAVWEVDRIKTNSWDVTMKLRDAQQILGTDKMRVTETPEKRTNYQVTVWLKKREATSLTPEGVDIEKLKKEVVKAIAKWDTHSPSKKNRRKSIYRVGFGAIADLHIGAKATKEKGLIRTKEFSLSILIEYLDRIAEKINSHNYDEVHISILGDIVESITGLNHINSWQSMEENIWEANAFITAYQVLSNFLSKINNLDQVYFISGNHDRLSMHNQQDVHGGAAGVVAFMLTEKGYPIEYHPLVVTAMVDGICYVLTHNHFKFATKDLSKIFFEYGKQGCYNVLLGGHWHERRTKQPNLKTYESVPIEAVDYRAIVVAPIFTGNFYSESLGYTSYAGFSLIESNDKRDNINHTDYSV